MIITCPACSARFNVADHLIGATGRVVRCAKCGHKWHQMPEGMEGMEPPPPPPKMQSQPPAPRPPSQKGMGPSPLPKLGDIPLQMPAKGFAEDDKEAGGAAHPDEDVDLSAALERVAGQIAETDARHTFESNAPNQVSRDEQPKQDVGEDFDFGDAEPIPEVFSKTAVKTKPAGGKAFGPLVMLLTLVVILGGVAFGGYYFRAQVVELLPFTNDLYAKLGIDAEALGSGLKFRNVTSERVVENNVEMLVVRGVIANITDKARDLPLIKLSLYDSANNEIQQKTMPAPESKLAPNESTGFKISVESPAAAARRFEVTFAPRPGQEEN